MAANESPFDALNPAYLPPTAGMELDYRTRELTDTEARHATLRFFLAAGASGALLAFGFRLVAEITATWLFLAIIGLIMSLHLISLYMSDATRGQLIGWAVFGPLLWLLSNFTTAGLHVLLWLFAGVLAMQLAHSVITHRALWMHAHPQLDRPTRILWQSAWKHATLRGAWRALISPTTAPEPHASAALVATERHERQRYHVAVGFVVVALLGATLIAMLVPGPFLNGIAGLGAYVTALIFFGAREARLLHPNATWIEVCRNVYDAWASWFTYNTMDTIAPGVFQSPGGSTARRMMTAYFVSLLIALAIVPVCAYFPLPVLIYGDGPWVEAGATAWILTERFDALPWDSANDRAASVPKEVLMRIPPAERERFLAARLAAQRAEARRHRTAVRMHDYEGYLITTLQGMSRGQPFFFVCMTTSVLACHAALGIFLVTTSFALGARRLLHHARTLEGTRTTRALYHRDPVASTWEAYVDRLRESRFQALDSKGRVVRECDHLLLGCNAVMDYPILMDRRILNEHAHITGDTGSGKTALGIAPLAVQLIGLPDTSVVIIDLKGDPALFEAARIRVEQLNRPINNKKRRLPFKWFTNHQGRHTFAFNPFLQGHFRQLTVQQKASMLLQSLGLDYGEGFGMSYFSAIHRDTLVKILRDDPRIRSFRDISRYFAMDLRNRRKDLNIEKRQFEEATHLYTVVDLLAGHDALNVTPENMPNTEVLRHQIDMSAVVQRPHVVYFYLSAPLEESSVREAAKLALHSLLTAAVHRGKSKHRVYVFVDEFQQVVSQNLEIVLRQARHYGISVILANQTLSDLKKNENINLIPTVQANTRLRQVFSASDVAAQEMHSLASGEQSYYTTSLGHSGPNDTYSITEQYGPRIHREDIIRFSDREQHSMVQITRGSGFTQFDGRLFPVVSEFHVSFEEYERRSEAPWPDPRAGTFVPPRESDHRKQAAPAAPSTLGASPKPSEHVQQPSGPVASKDDLEARLDNLFAEKEPSE